MLLVAFIQFPLKLAGNLRYLSYLYVYGFPFIYLIFNTNWTFGLYKSNKRTKFQFFKLIYLYLFFIAVFWPLILGTFDFSYVFSYWKGMILWGIKYTFLIVVYKKHVNQKGGFEEFSGYFIRGVSLYVMVSLAFLILSPIRKLMLKIIYLSNADIINMRRLEYQTRFGWTGWSGFNETFMCTIAIILACILILNNNDNIGKQKKYLALMIFPLVGNALYGRIGLLCSVICILMTCFFVFMKGNMKYVLEIAAVFLMGFAMFIILKERVEIFKGWYRWIFSAFENYCKTGKFYDNMGSIEHLTTDMYWLPKWDTFLFGDGRYLNADGSYYMHTDSGIMRPMLYYGIGNYIMSALAMILLAKEFAFSVIKHGNRRNVKLIIVILILSVAIFEFKGESLWMFTGILLPITLMPRLKARKIKND